MGDTGRRFGRAGLLAVLLCAAGCGGSDGATVRLLKGGAEAAYALAVTSEILPGAQTGRAYGPVRLEAEGADADLLRWSLWDGSLPAGISLAEDGTLAGTPTERGTAVFTVHVTDGPRVGLATLALAVEDLAFWACDGLVADEAWVHGPVALAVAGGTGPYRFAADRAPSGGSLRGVDAERGRATWVPGSAGGALCTDVLRVTDLETGVTRALRIPVRPDPTARFVAAFGTTDVWYVNTTAKVGAHPFATDMHKALADLGLRGPESTDRMGRPVDRLAALWVRREVLRELARHYRLDAGPAEVLAISFPFHEPGEGYARPAPGTWAPAQPNHYNEIAVLDGASSSVIGTAFIDAAHNPLVENDTSAGGSILGAFVNVLVDYFNVLYASPLRHAPLGADDLDAVHALLHDLPSPGGRYDAIAQQGRQFARVLAIVLAHEIGHSLGVPHTEPRVPDSLMNAQAAIEPWADPYFLPADLASLRERLPGPGRGRSPDGSFKPALPEGGVSACEGETCDLRLPQVPSPVVSRSAPRPGG